MTSPSWPKAPCSTWGNPCLPCCQTTETPPAKSPPAPKTLPGSIKLCQCRTFGVADTEIAEKIPAVNCAIAVNIQIICIENVIAIHIKVCPLSIATDVVDTKDKVFFVKLNGLLADYEVEEAN